MKKIITLLCFIFVFGTSYSQITIDGDMLDWAGIDPLDTGLPAESYGVVQDPTYIDFNLKHVYITHDSANVYCKIDLDDAANFNNFYNFSNPPVFEMYFDTEIGDTSGFDWGWWNNAYKYYINLAPTLHPDSLDKHGELYLYTGGRMPTYLPGEFVLLALVPMAINSENNQLEFSVPRNLINFGSEFRPWIYSVGDYQWDLGASQLPLEGVQDYMLKYDFWYGGAVYQHNGTQIVSEITIDGDLLDWVGAGIQPADVGACGEELGDMPTGPSFDVKDYYLTSDSTYLYVRVDIDPNATFAEMYNYSNPPVFQLYFEVNWGDTTGLGWGGFYRLPVDYLVDLSAALHPDSSGTEILVQKFIGDYNGASEVYMDIEGANIMFAKNTEDNVVEIAIPRSGINAGTDIRPWFYIVGDQIWTQEEYVPNPIIEGWGGAEGEYYAIDYNFMTGSSVHRLGDNSITSVDDYYNTSTVDGFGLVSNFPNPFNPTTTIEFTLPEQEIIKVEVFDILGSKIATLIDNQELSAGQKRLVWNGKNENGVRMVSGIYLYRISSDKFSISKKMMLLK